MVTTFEPSSELKPTELATTLFERSRSSTAVASPATRTLRSKVSVRVLMRDSVTPGVGLTV